MTDRSKRSALLRAGGAAVATAAPDQTSMMVCWALRMMAGLARQLVRPRTLPQTAGKPAPVSCHTHSFVRKLVTRAHNTDKSLHLTKTTPLPDSELRCRHRRLYRCRRRRSSGQCLRSSPRRLSCVKIPPLLWLEGAKDSPLQLPCRHPLQLEVPAARHLRSTHTFRERL
jgi:hypothetical protein